MLKKEVKYLGLAIDSQCMFGKHVVEVIGRANERMALLGRLMPNMGGLSSGKRSVMCGMKRMKRREISMEG